MTESLIELWDKNNHKLILCCSVPINTGSVCELCGTWLWALPESVKFCERPDAHLICRTCFEKIVPGRTVKWKGKFSTSADAKRILPLLTDDQNDEDRKPH